MTDDELQILKIMSSNIIGDDVVPPHSRPWLKGLKRLGFVGLVGKRVWAITKEGRSELKRRWQSKILNEPRLGFVKEHGAKQKPARRAKNDNLKLD